MSKFSKLYNQVLEGIAEDNDEALAALEELLDHVKQQGYDEGYDSGLDAHTEPNDYTPPLQFDGIDEK